MLVKNLFSREVIDDRGDKVGKVTDMDVDMKAGVINYIVISTGFMNKRDVRLDKIKSVGDTVILNVKKDAL